MKRSLLTDGSGIPLAIVVDGANRHDSKLLCATLDGVVIVRPEPGEEYPQHLCLDSAYDYQLMCILVRERGYLDHIRSRGEEKAEKVTIPGYRARRWVVERTFAWIGRHRRMSKDYEYLTSSSENMIYLTMIRLLVRRLARAAEAAREKPRQARAA